MATGGGAAASSAAAMPYIGSKISLITNSELRYEGKLVSINTANSTVILSGVRMFGTEDRRGANFVMASPEVFDYIVFNGRDVKDLTVSEGAFSVKEDPAVVAVNVAPHRMGGGPGGMPLGGMSGGMMHHGGQQGGGGRYNGGPLSGRYGDYDRRGGGRGIGGGTLPPRGGGGVVGELTAQPNSSLKSQLADNFNFEEANSKFVKDAQEATTSGTEQLISGPVYDKSTSFFDHISCEALNRQQGRTSKLAREKQREIDTETFGSAAAARGPRYYRRGGYNRRTGGPGGMRGGPRGYHPDHHQRNSPGMYGNHLGGPGGLLMNGGGAGRPMHHMHQPGAGPLQHIGVPQ